MRFNLESVSMLRITLITKLNRKIISWVQCLNHNRALTVPDTVPNGIEFGAEKA